MRERAATGRPVPFARRLLAHARTRTGIAAAGLGFAILVMFLQLGFQSAVTRTATAITSHLDADLVLVSPRFVHLSEAGSFPRARLFQARALPEVASSSPLYLRYARWRDPATGERCKLFALGHPLSDGAPLRGLGLAEQRRALEANGSLLLDRRSQRDCGPASADGRVEVREQAARVVGGFTLGVGFLADGALVTSDDTFATLFRGSSQTQLARAQLGLVRLVDGADPGEVAPRLASLLPPDVRVLTRAELDERQLRHWVRNTAVGNVFALGTLAGLCVGLAVAFQVLATEVRNQLPRYATLRAMGYGEATLRRFVAEQAAWLAALAFVPALLLATATFTVVHAVTRLPIFMTPQLALAVAALSLGLCIGAALLSARRLRAADPAELF